MSPFTTLLLQWWAIHQRQLPWKNTQDPYLIWLSEIMLQQTRVEQALPYYERLSAAFPTVKHLADASTDDLMRLWEGLGYYSRARNLHATAKHIAYQLDGHFPNTYQQILQLKGVGHYTAAAIASFAYNLPHAVVDGNVFRVLSRVFGIETPIDSTKGKQQFTQLANQFLPPNRPADFNQAIMDFGAIQCTPKPNCDTCSLQNICIAFEQKKTTTLPIKEKKIVKKERFFHYLLITNPQQQIYINRRTARDIWRHLYEFPCIETNKLLTNVELFPHINQLLQTNIAIENTSKPYTQQLTHRTVHAIFHHITCRTTPTTPAEWQRIPAADLSQYPFPKIITQFLADQSQQQQILF